jgi:hypothetical protein
MNTNISFLRTSFILLLVFIVGCAPTKQAIYLDSNFQKLVIDNIALMPPVDIRIDTSEDANTNDFIRKIAMNDLMEKGYGVINIRSMGNLLITKDDFLNSIDSISIKRIGSTNNRWIMFIVLIDVSTTLTLGSTGNAEVAGYLFDKKNGILVWKDKGIGKVGQGGLIGMAMKSGMAEYAINDAIINLMSSFPRRVHR